MFTLMCSCSPREEGSDAVRSLLEDVPFGVPHRTAHQTRRARTALPCRAEGWGSCSFPMSVRGYAKQITCYFLRGVAVCHATGTNWISSGLDPEEIRPNVIWLEFPDRWRFVTWEGLSTKNFSEEKFRLLRNARRRVVPSLGG